MGMTNTASRIIAKYGQTAILQRPAPLPVHPWDPPAGNPTSYMVTAAVAKYRIDHVDGSLIEANDRRIFMSVDGLTVVPALSDKLVIGGISYTLVGIHPLAPDGVVRFYELQARA